jgi:hypothetical protein
MQELAVFLPFLPHEAGVRRFPGAKCAPSNLYLVQHRLDVNLPRLQDFSSLLTVNIELSG